MTVPAILVITGVDGVGKSALVDALEQRSLPGVRCFRFDTIGTPSVTEMIAEHGSPRAWQVAAMQQWIVSLLANPWRCRVAVLEGEIPPEIVQQAFAEHGLARGGIVVLVCGEAVRRARRAPRAPRPARGDASPESWARAFREQAEALALTMIDTTSMPLAATVDRVVAELTRLAGPG